MTGRSSSAAAGARRESATPPAAQAASDRALRGAALLAVRQGLVSLVTLGGVLGLSALLSPSDFAVYGYVTTVILIAAGVGDLGLGANLIKGEPTDRDLRGSVALQLAFWLPVCALGALAGAAVHVYGFSTATTALLFAVLFLLCLQTLPTALLERRMAFGAIASVETVQRIVFVSTAIALAGAAPHQWSIPVAAAGAAMISLPAMLFLSRWRWLPRFARGEPLFRGFSSHWWQSRIANQLAYAAYPLLGGILFSSAEVGLMIWALAVTSVPALMSPMVARAAFPAMARTDAEHRVEVFRPLLKGLLLIGFPLAVAIFACARPLTEYVLGSKWLEGVVLLRLESVTTCLGIVLTVVIPLLFLVLPAARVKWITVGWTASIFAMSIPLAAVVSFRAISIAQIIAASAVFAIVERQLRLRAGYSLLRDMWPGLVGIAVALGVGIPLAGVAGDALSTLAIAAAVGIVALATTVLLGGGVDPRVLLRGIGKREAVPDAAELAGPARP